MQVERFQGKTMREALEQVKRKLGDDAVILATRTVRAGAKGLLGERRFEVSALPPERPAEPQPTQAFFDRSPSITPDELERMIAPLLDPLRHELRTVRSQLRGAAEPLRRDLRRTIEELRATVSAVSQARAGAGDEIRAKLEETGMSSQMAQKLLAEARAAVGDENLDSPEARALLLVMVEQAITRRVKVNPGLPQRGRPERVVAVVGPTGVGKTTTVAKLASIAALVEHRKVALITMDTYRVGGVEQLRRFATLIGLPMSVAQDGESLREALLEHRDADLVLIDTAGRSPRQPDAFDALVGALSRANEPIDVQLALPAAARLLELDATLRRYAPLNPSKLIVTKADEAVAGGAVLEACVRSGLPVSFVCTGQRVPEDISPASLTWLAAFVLGQEEN